VDETPLGVIIPDEPARPKRRPAGPLLAGSIAIALATRIAGGVGLVAAVCAVGSWWVYKFWPRPWVANEPEAQAFIDQLEGVRPDEIDLIPPAKPGSGADILDIRL
jgi:hypothetical protein